MDIAPLVRAQGWCRDSARVGVTLAGLSALLMFAGWYWAVIPLFFLAAAHGTARCSRVAAIAHLAGCTATLVVLGVWMADLHRWQSAREIPVPPFRSWLVILVLTIIAFVVALLLLGVVGAFVYRKRLPMRLAPQNASRYGLLRRLALLRSPKLPKVLVAVLACAICIAPIVVPLALFNRLEPMLWGVTWWTVCAYIIVAVVGLWGFAHFATKTKRLGALAAGQAQGADTRPPVLLLRSFSDDLTPVYRDIDPGSRYQLSWLYPKLWTLEEAIGTVLAEWGPVIAIGQPGEALPPAGAAREYLPNDAWHERVCELMGEARFVVVILGSTKGLEYEYRLLAEAGALPRLVAVLPSAPDLVSRWQRFSEAVGLTEPLPTEELTRTLVARFAGEPVLFTCRERSTDGYRIALNCALRG